MTQFVIEKNSEQLVVNESVLEAHVRQGWNVIGEHVEKAKAKTPTKTVEKAKE